MGQTWEDLLFAHWRLPESALRALVPAELELDRFGGETWVGITPFRMTGVRLRGTLPVPGLSAFPELNVRTYVTDGRRPGIFFFSLDAGSTAAVAAARRFYRLPYFRARMSARKRGSSIVYASRRTEPGAHLRAFGASYRPVGEVFHAEPGTIEHFLTERYCLYTFEGRLLLRAEIHHALWPLQPAEAEIEENTMPPRPIELDGEPLLHFARRQDVVVWPLESADGKSLTAAAAPVQAVAEQ
ncbi:MAG: YqjF family protein [Gaiellaceae bacterium]